MAKLCYHFSFIDEESESTSMLGMKRAQSCKIPEHGLERVDWQSQMQVRTLHARSQHVADQTQAMLEFPKPGASYGSHGHPHLCRRPCILFLRGNCQEGAECGYCHASHPQRAATFDRHQRRILISWSKVQLLEVVLPYFRERVEGINHPGTAVLLELVERELAIRDPGHHSVVVEVPRLIHHTLAGMTLSALVGVICSKNGNLPFARLLEKALVDLRQQVGGIDGSTG
ncbi:C3H1-type domain-containing protein [Durusdinium trenchii]